MSRTREERLASTVLGEEGWLRIPKRLTVGLQYPEEAREPVAKVLELLVSCGFSSPEEARRNLETYLPSKKMVAMPWSGTPSLCPEPGPNGPSALVEAIILGLCTANLYDPSRPVIWTQSSLTRRLELFDLGGFYEA
jgi:hypothetical protein